MGGSPRGCCNNARALSVLMSYFSNKSVSFHALLVILWHKWKDQKAFRKKLLYQLTEDIEWEQEGKKSKNKVIPVMISIKGDIELQEKWHFLRNKGAFVTNKEFLAHLLHLEEERYSCMCDK